MALHSSFDTNVGQGNQQTGAIYIFDGATGTLLHSIRAVRGGGIYPEQGPVVADVNGDGSAEIVTGGWNGMPLLHVFEGKNGPWAKARPIYNQVHYNVTNVNSDGTIPAHPAINWLTPGLNNFRVNIPLPQERTGDKDQFTYKANDGALDSNTATVRIDILAAQSRAADFIAAADGGVAEYRVFVRSVGVRCRRGRNSYILIAAGAHRHDHQSGQRIGALDAHRQARSAANSWRSKVTDSQGEFAYQGYSIEVRRRRDRARRGGPDASGRANRLWRAPGLRLGTIVTTASNTVPVGPSDQPGDSRGNKCPGRRGSQSGHLLGTADSHGSQRRGTNPSCGPKCN